MAMELWSLAPESPALENGAPESPAHGHVCTRALCHREGSAQHRDGWSLLTVGCLSFPPCSPGAAQCARNPQPSGRGREGGLHRWASMFHPPARAAPEAQTPFATSEKPPKPETCPSPALQVPPDHLLRSSQCPRTLRWLGVAHGAVWGEQGGWACRGGRSGTAPLLHVAGGCFWEMEPLTLGAGA